MYESFYRLKQRPFAAAPDASLFVETPAVADALTRLDRCVRQGGGVAVLTGAAGIGKTQLLHCLFDRLQSEFGVIRVPNASFSSPRGFLQYLLAEFGESFERLGVTELRLRLTAAANDARAMTSGIVLLLDEAHRYGDRLLEEVRLTANHVEGGQPLFRIVMAGQISLEDRLAEGGQSGLNERIGELVTLPRLTGEESRTYLASRAAQAGGDIDDLFEPPAIEVMIRACGGVPRCLNQLADHALLLGFVAERTLVSESLVREALEDLKRLPLQWHDPLPGGVSRGGEGERRRGGDDLFGTSIDIGDSEESFDEVVEIGALDSLEDDEEDFDWDSSSDLADAETESVLEDDDEENDEPPHDLRPQESPIRPVPEPAPALERISDRFARLDAVDAQRRWLDAWERAETESSQQPDADRPPIEAVTRVRNEQPPQDPAKRTIPLEKRQSSDTDMEQDDETPPRGVWNTVPKSATLFRDLRRRQGLT